MGTIKVDVKTGDRCGKRIRRNAASHHQRLMFVIASLPSEVPLPDSSTLDALANQTELCTACSRTIQSAIDRIRAVKGSG